MGFVAHFVSEMSKIFQPLGLPPEGPTVANHTRTDGTVIMNFSQ